MKVTFVGISGGSGAGKTSLAGCLASLFSGETSVLQFDCYYKDHGHLSLGERKLVNYDHPDSLDKELFVTHLDELAAGRLIEVPVYDFETHTRTFETETIFSKPLIILDGILLLVFPEIRSRLDLAVYIEAPQATRLARRVFRDVSERGRTEEGARSQFASTVTPMHELYVAPSLKEADLVLDGSISSEKTARIVRGHLKNL